MATDKLLAFCDTESDRYALGKPWVRGGWRYATDGRIAVREPTTEPDTDDGQRRPKTVYGLFRCFPRCTKPWPHHDGETEHEELVALQVGVHRIKGEAAQLIEELGTVLYAAARRASWLVKFRSGQIQGVVAVLSQD